MARRQEGTRRGTRRGRQRERKEALAARAADRLHSAAIHLLRSVRREDPAPGLSPARLSALSVLVYGGPRSLGELAAAEQVRPPTMTRLVQTLEAAGLVERRRDPDDARVTRLSATADGRRVLEEARRRRLAHLAQALSRFRAPELHHLLAAAEMVEEVFGPEAAGGRREVGAPRRD